MKKRFSGFAVAASLLAILGFAPIPSSAVPVACPNFGACTVSNTTATIGLDSSSPRRDELREWSINGLDHLWSTQWSVRTGGVTNTLDFASTATADEDTDTLATTKSTSDFEISFEYVLAPDGLSIAETVTLTNTTGSTADFRVFGRTDYDLAAGSSGELGVFDPTTNTFTQTDPANPEFIATWTANSLISGWQMPLSTFDSSIDALSNTSLSAGPLDIRFAFSFDTTLSSQESVTFSTTKMITIVPVPEPGSVALFGLGGLMVVAWSRKSGVRRGRSSKEPVLVS